MVAKICCKCGRCCVDFSVPKVGFYQMYSFLREYPYIYYSGMQRAGSLLVPVFRCENLIEKVGGVAAVAVCRDYINRPPFCKEFPRGKQSRPQGCGLKDFLHSLLLKLYECRICKCWNIVWRKIYRT